MGEVRGSCVPPVGDGHHETAEARVGLHPQHPNKDSQTVHRLETFLEC